MDILKELTTKIDQLQGREVPAKFESRIKTEAIKDYTEDELSLVSDIMVILGITTINDYRTDKLMKRIREFQSGKK